MKKRRKKERVYWRSRGGVPRAYGDFRDFGSLGGKQEPLIPPGETMATTDPDVAHALAARRLNELEGWKREVGITGRRRAPTLYSYALEHLKKKDKAKRVTSDWVSMAELYLTRACQFFGRDRELSSITAEDVATWANVLASTKYVARGSKTGAKGKSLSPGTVRHALNALSNLYRHAISEGKLKPGTNPVSNWLDKPSGPKREARWLEVHEGALLLESARTLPKSPLRDALPADVAHALIATHLLTGGRSAEVRGLEVSDISFDRDTVTFRPNTFRRLKTLPSARVIPLHPQLREILSEYLMNRPPAKLLFPSFITGKEAMVEEWRGTLDRVAVRAGWVKGEMRTRIFRHTYCAARLQTLDGGAPVSPYTVSRELGHGSLAMVEKVYSHLGTIRHRSDHPEYRIEQHTDKLHDRLQALA